MDTAFVFLLSVYRVAAPADVWGVAILCVEMNRCYPSFAKALALIRPLLSCVAALIRAGGGRADVRVSQHVLFRLLARCVLHGVIGNPKAITRIVTEAAGAPLSGATDRKSVTRDTNLIVTPAKASRHKILWVVPWSVRGLLVQRQKDE